MKEYYLRLYNYNEWANDLFANALAEADYSHEKIDVFFSHIAAAQLIWLNRVTESDQEVPGVWEKLSLDDASEQLSAGNIGWLDFIAECDDFKSEVRYKNSKGEAFTTPLKDILTHVANHSTHHRGQIALLLREEGIAPPASDFIFYCRESHQKFLISLYFRCVVCQTPLTRISSLCQVLLFDISNFFCLFLRPKRTKNPFR